MTALRRPPLWLLILVLANIAWLLGSIRAGLEMTRPPEAPAAELFAERPLPPPSRPLQADGTEAVARAAALVPRSTRDLLAKGVPPSQAAGILEAHSESLGDLRKPRGLPFRGSGCPLPEAAVAARLLALAVETEARQGRPDAALGRLHDGLSFAVRGMWELEDPVGSAYPVLILLEPVADDASLLARASTPALRELHAGLEGMAAVRTTVEQAHLAARPQLFPEHLPGFLASPARDAFRQATLSELEPLRRREWGRLRSLALRRELQWRPDSARPYLLYAFRRGGFMASLAAGFAPEAWRWAPPRLAAEFGFDALRVRVAAELSRRGEPVQVPGPSDPFAPWQPLRTSGDKVWSVGPDGLDGGGRPLLAPSRLDWRAPGDLVAP